MSFLKVATSFEAIQPLYQKYDIENKNGEITIKTGIKLFEALPTAIGEPLYILDKHSIIHSKRKTIPLKPISDTDIDIAFRGADRDFLLGKIKDIRIDGSWTAFKQYVFEADYAFKDEMINSFVDAQTNEPTQEYKEMIEQIIAFNAKKDKTICLTDKAVMPKGEIMKYQPHKIVITEPAVGKSTFAEKMGPVYDKVTRNTLLGSIFKLNEKSAGLFNDQYYLLTLEQIESQQVENLAGFLLSFLESGSVRVSGAGAEMTVTGACPLNVTGNPPDLKGNHLATLRDMITTLCRNSFALGRRFGILAFNQYAPLIDYGYDDVKHTEYVEIFRAMEERAKKTLIDIWYHPKIQEYCLRPIYNTKDGDRELAEAISSVDSIEIRGFLRAHIAHSYPHIRGGSINCAIVDLLPVIALRDIFGIGDLDTIVDRILVLAENYAKKLKQVNVDSIHFSLITDGV